MPQFLTTSHTTSAIERVINDAESQIVLISPYLQISTIFTERLMDAARRKVNITICYGKEEMTAAKEREIREIPGVTLRFMTNLHAKCYYNEKELIITSMNLYSYSEKNNREMGVSMSLAHDEVLYKDALRECQSILQHAKPKDSTVPTAKSESVANAPATKQSINYRNWKEKLVDELGMIFGEKISFRDGAELGIKCSSHNLECFVIFDRGSHRLVISKILSGLLYDFLKHMPNLPGLPANAKFGLEKGKNGSYNMAHCELKLPLKTERLNFVAPEDVEVVYNFMLGYAKSIHRAVKQFNLGSHQLNRKL